MNPARILIVEDDDAISTGLTAALELDGHRALVVSDGVTALEQIEQWAPDLVLLDLMLPELDGLSVLRWLRRRDRKLRVDLVCQGQRGSEG